MEFKEERRPLNPLHGIVLFLIIMILFIFVFAPLQYYLGMTGLLLTELGLLAVTMLAVLVTKQSFREVFPIHRPRFGQIMGTILLWAGCFLFTMLVTLILMLFFPKGFAEVSSSMNAVFSSIPAFFSFLIVAVSPAVCEEAMHRGFIMHTFRGISRDWIAVLCIGLIFGLFHLDPYRFLPTALLGMGLAYVMRKTNNILFPALFHFINNSLSFLSSLSASSQETRRFRQGLFSASRQQFTVTRSSQRRRCSSPSKVPLQRKRRKKTSCTASSASWELPRAWRAVR